MGGYVCYACGRLKLKVEFAPAVVFSSIIAVLTLAGYLNVLLFAAWAIYLGGFALLIWHLTKKKIKAAFQQKPAVIGAVFALLLTAYAVVHLKGARLTYYDDFSHWGTIVKEMLIYNRLPNAQSAAISFKSYPPGSALFIYFVSLMTGASESKMLIAQALLNISFLFALFGIVKSSAKILTQLVLAAAAAVILFATPLDNLWVDTLLATSGIAAFAVLFAYRNDLRRASLYALPIMIASVMIKNDGFVFALANLSFLFYLAARPVPHSLPGQPHSKKFLYPLMALLVLAVTFFLWTRHWQYVFPSESGKHAVSISNYVKVFGAKTPEDVQNIILNFLRWTSNWKTPSTAYFLAANLLTLILCLVFRTADRRKARLVLGVLLFADVVFLLYLMGLLAMYLLSMPTEEAARLAAYARYASSIVNYHLAVLVTGYAILSQSDFPGRQAAKKSNFSWRHAYGVGLAVTVFLLGAVYLGNFHGFTQTYTQGIPGQFDKIAGENDKGYTNEKYCVYYAKDEPVPAITVSYVNYMARYKMLPASSVTMITFDEDELFRNLEKCTTLIVLEADTQMKEFMTGYTEKSDCRGVYPIKSTFFPDD